MCTSGVNLRCDPKVCGAGVYLIEATVLSRFSWKTVVRLGLMNTSPADCDWSPCQYITEPYLAIKQILSSARFMERFIHKYCKFRNDVDLFKIELFKTLFLNCIYTVPPNKQKLRKVCEQILKACAGFRQTN